MKLFVALKNQKSWNEKKKVYLGIGYNLYTVYNLAIQKINPIF